MRDTVRGQSDGAQIKLTDTGTQQAHVTTSDAQGRYTLSNLPVGNYELTVVANGFKTYIQQGIILQVANNVEINVTMQIGTVAESMSVTNYFGAGCGTCAPGFFNEAADRHFRQCRTNLTQSAGELEHRYGAQPDLPIHRALEPGGAG